MEGTAGRALRPRCLVRRVCSLGVVVWVGMYGSLADGMFQNRLDMKVCFARLCFFSSGRESVSRLLCRRALSVGMHVVHRSLAHVVLFEGEGGNESKSVCAKTKVVAQTRARAVRRT